MSLSSYFRPILTDAGRAAALAAVGLGGVTVASVRFGTGAYDTRDGSGDPVPAEQARTALAAEQISVAIAAGSVVDQTLHLRFVVGAVAPSFIATEIGLFLNDGTLFAVASSSTAVFAELDGDTSLVIEFLLTLTELPDGSVTVTFSEPIVAELQEQVDLLQAMVQEAVEDSGQTWNLEDETQLATAIRHQSGFAGYYLRGKEFWENGTWTVPAGVFRVFLGGLGGGGGGARADFGTGKGASGGGPGAYDHLWLDVVPGDVIAFTIAAGGTPASTVDAAGSNGGTTTITLNGVAVLTLEGGEGGKVGTLAAGVLGGLPGTAYGGESGVTGGRAGNVAAGAITYAGTGGGAPGSMFGDGGRGGDVAAGAAGITGGGAMAEGHSPASGIGGQFGRPSGTRDPNGNDYPFIEHVLWPLSVCITAAIVSVIEPDTVTTAGDLSYDRGVLDGGKPWISGSYRNEGGFGAGGGSSNANNTSGKVSGPGGRGAGGAAIVGVNGSGTAGPGGKGWGFILWEAPKEAA